MLKLMVFDWDGTLADSVGMIIKCKRFLAQKYSLAPPSEETVKNVLGIQFEEAMTRCFPCTSRELLKQLGEEFHALMQQEDYQAMLFPYANTVLEILKKRGIKLAVASSKDKRELDKAIIYNRLANLFDAVCCGKEFQEKPGPAMLKYMLKKFKVKSNECLMVGDTTTDILFATNADVKTIAVTFGAHSVEKLVSMKPFALIDEWKQIFTIIDGLCYST